MQARGLVGESEEAPGTIDVQPSQLMPTGRKVDEAMQSTMGGMLSGMNIPGL